MHVGVMMHATDTTPDPLAVAVEAEARGFESLFVTEHTHIPVRDRITWWGGRQMPEEYKRLHDPLIALATCVAATSRIRLGTGVSVIAQRNALIVAKQLASLDRLSGGRLIVGTGYGWRRDELADHDIAWPTRRAAWRETLDAVRVVWTDDESSFTGERIAFGPCWSYPKPLQPQGPPVLLGALGTKDTLLDVVERADGWMPLHGTEPIPERWTQLQELAEDRQRDPATIELTVAGLGADTAACDTHQAIGARRVVAGLPTSGFDDIRRHLDDLQPLIDRYRST